MQGGHLAQRREVRHLAREDVILGDRLERISGENQIQRMTGFGQKIDAETAKHGVHRGDASEAPALVHAIAAFGEHDQPLDVLLLDFSRRHQFFKLFFHR